MTRLRNTRRMILVVVGILIGVLAVLFVLTNKEPVVLKLLYVETIPLWSSVLVLASMAVGAALTLVFTFWLGLKHRSERRRLKRRLNKMEDELIGYRNQALDEPDTLPPSTTTTEREADEP